MFAKGQTVCTGPAEEMRERGLGRRKQNPVLGWRAEVAPVP